MQIYLPFSLCILCVQTMHGILLGIATIAAMPYNATLKWHLLKRQSTELPFIQRGDCKIFDSIRSHLKYAVYGWLNKIQPRSLTRAAAGCHL